MRRAVKDLLGRARRLLRTAALHVDCRSDLREWRKRLLSVAAIGHLEDRIYIRVTTLPWSVLVLVLVLVVAQRRQVRPFSRPHATSRDVRRPRLVQRRKLEALVIRVGCRRLAAAVRVRVKPWDARRMVQR